MEDHRTIRLATIIVVATGTLWGFYWMPVRHLEAAGLSGAWGTFAITAAATLVLLPAALRHRAALGAADRVTLAAVTLGGAAFALYSVGLVYGRVAIIILLFFLTPVWSTLIGRYVLGWRTPLLRVLAIGVGLAGLGVMLGAQGEWPVPRNIGEWMALISGMGWSVATTGIRTRATLPPVPAAFVFALGAAVAALVLAPMLTGWPDETQDVRWGAALAVAIPAGALWWAASMAGLIWATARLEPARVGILLMAEVLVGSGSAALLAGEHLSPTELAGGGLVLLAGIFEIWPVRRATRPT